MESGVCAAEREKTPSIKSPARKKSVIQSAIPNGLEMSPKSQTISAFEINLTEAATIITPRMTLITFIHDPLFWRDSRYPGNMANRIKGLAKAAEKPWLRRLGATRWPPVVAASLAPTNGGVQEKETPLMVKPIKRVPVNPLPSLLFLLSQLVSL